MRRWDFPITLAVVVLAVAATAAAFASHGVRDALISDGRSLDGQPWRLVTGAFMHATWGHLLRDLALVAIAGIAYEGPLGRYRFAAFGGGLVVPVIAVLVTHEAVWYCGLSGLSHALLGAAFAYEATYRRGRTRAIVRVIGVIAALKPLYELITGGPVFPMQLGPGVGEQVPLAHVAGVLVGIPCGILAALNRLAGEPAATRPPRAASPARPRLS